MVSLAIPLDGAGSPVLLIQSRLPPVVGWRCGMLEHFMNFFGSKDNNQDKDQDFLGLSSSVGTDTPKPDQTTVSDPVKNDPPQQETPKLEPPKVEPVQQDTPKPKTEPEITATGLPDMSQTQVSKTQVSGTDSSGTENSGPKPPTPKQETPKLPVIPVAKPPTAPVAFNGGGTPALLQAGTEDRPESEGPKYEDINGNPYTGTDAQAWAEADTFFGRKSAAQTSDEVASPALDPAPDPSTVPAPVLGSEPTPETYTAETIVPLATRMGWRGDQPMPSATPSPNQKDVTTPTPDEIEDIVPGATDHQLWLLGAQAFYRQKLATAQKTGAQKTGDQAAIDHAALNITGLNERIDVSLSPAQKKAIDQKKIMADKAKTSQMEPAPAPDPTPDPNPSADEFAGLDATAADSESSHKLIPIPPEADPAPDDLNADIVAAALERRAIEYQALSDTEKRRAARGQRYEKRPLFLTDHPLLEQKIQQAMAGEIPYWEAYDAVAKTMDILKHHDPSTQYWFQQASVINSNGAIRGTADNAANMFVRGLTVAAKMLDGETATASQLQHISDSIAHEVLGHILETGQIDTVNHMLERDIDVALKEANMQIETWPGAFYYWNAPYTDPKTGDPSTIGEVILSDEQRLERFIDVASMATRSVAAQEFGETLDGKSFPEIFASLSGIFGAEVPLGLKIRIIGAFIFDNINNDKKFKMKQ